MTHPKDKWWGDCGTYKREGTAKSNGRGTCKSHKANEYLVYLFLIFYSPFQTCTTGKVKLTFCGEWIYPFLLLVKHLLPGFWTWNFSQIKSWSLGCGLMGTNVRFWKFIFLNELNSVSSLRTCSHERFLPSLTLCFILTVCSQIRKKQKFSETNTHTQCVKICFYSLWYHFSFPTARYSLELLIKVLRTQNTFLLFSSNFNLFQKRNISCCIF